MKACACSTHGQALAQERTRMQPMAAPNPQKKWCFLLTGDRQGRTAH